MVRFFSRTLTSLIRLSLSAVEFLIQLGPHKTRETEFVPSTPTTGTSSVLILNVFTQAVPSSLILILSLWQLVDLPAGPIPANRDLRHPQSCCQCHYHPQRLRGGRRTKVLPCEVRHVPITLLSFSCLKFRSNFCLPRTGQLWTWSENQRHQLCDRPRL